MPGNKVQRKEVSEAKQEALTELAELQVGAGQGWRRRAVWWVGWGKAWGGAALHGVAQWMCSVGCWGGTVAGASWPLERGLGAGRGKTGARHGYFWAANKPVTRACGGKERAAGS